MLESLVAVAVAATLPTLKTLRWLVVSKLDTSRWVTSICPCRFSLTGRNVNENFSDKANSPFRIDQGATSTEVDQFNCEVFLKPNMWPTVNVIWMKEYLLNGTSEPAGYMALRKTPPANQQWLACSRDEGRKWNCLETSRWLAFTVMLRVSYWRRRVIQFLFGNINTSKIYILIFEII